MHGNVLQFGRSCVGSPETARLPQKASCSQATGLFRAPTFSDAVRAQSGAISESDSQFGSVAPRQGRAVAPPSNHRVLTWLPDGVRYSYQRAGAVPVAGWVCWLRPAVRKMLRPRGCRQQLSIAPLRAARNPAGIRPKATDRRFEHTTQKTQSGQKNPL